MKRAIGVLLMSVFFVYGCKTSFKVTSDFPQGGDFKVYKSFKFFNPKNIPGSNFSFSEENKNIIFDAVANEMNLKGYMSIQGADVIIKVQGGTRSTQEVKNDRSPMYDPYSYRYGYPYYRDRYSSQYQDISKKETTIIIDMMDVKKDKLIWQGVGVGVLGKKANEVESKIREAIHQIFQEFPYEAPL